MTTFQDSDRSNALPACRDYLHGWLRHCRSYVERTQADGSAEGMDPEVAWRATSGETARGDVAVRFDSQPLTTPCAIEAIRVRCEDIRKLKHQEAGTTVSDLCRELGISAGTFYNWRSKCGGLEVDEAKRLRELESENGKLKRLLARSYLRLRP